MSQTADIKRKIFGKNSFSTVVDIAFSQLIPANTTTNVTPDVQVEDFFNTYNSLFYDIPSTGSVNSHLELINRSSDYLGISYTDLLEELRVTRNENVSLKNQLIVLEGL